MKKGNPTLPSFQNDRERYNAASQFKMWRFVLFFYRSHRCIVLIVDPAARFKTFRYNKFILSMLHKKIKPLDAIYRIASKIWRNKVFVWAYERSCALYSTMRKSLGEPDPFRMQYRNELHQVIGEIVRHGMNKTEAIAAIRKRAAAKISLSDQPRFIEIVERELQSLHEGNIARFRLRLAEYEHWKKTWR